VTEDDMPMDDGARIGDSVCGGRQAKASAVMRSQHLHL
jgi:hypothetical protein